MKAELEALSAYVAQEITIETIITHGREASANGTLTFSREESAAFCDVYHFVNTKHNVIKYLKSYSIQLN